MVASLLGGYTAGGVVHEHHLEEIKSVVVKVRAEGLGHVALPLWKGGLEIREAGLVRNAWPFGFSRGT